MTDYQSPMFERLEPRTPFKGGRITDTDVLTLSEAARFASVHAGTEITPADILRAGARGEIPLAAIVHQRAKVQMPGDGVCINEGHPTDENVIPKGAIPTLPLKACQQLAAAGHASWRTLDGFKNVDGELCRYTKFKLTDDEPDFVTTPDDCRLTGYNVHALADAFIDEPAPVDGIDARPDPERRLALLRELGGAAKYYRYEWTFTGIGALVASEKANGCKRSTEKTIRADLREAAQNEQDARSAGFASGLGQR